MLQLTKSLSLSEKIELSQADVPKLNLADFPSIHDRDQRIAFAFAAKIVTARDFDEAETA